MYIILDMFYKIKYRRTSDTILKLFFSKTNTILKLWLPKIYIFHHMDQEWTPDLLKKLKVYLSVGWQVLGGKYNYGTKAHDYSLREAEKRQ